MSSLEEEKKEEQNKTLGLPIYMTLREFRLNGIDTDITIVCKDGEELKAHSLILSASTPYFKQMFRGKFKESETKVVDFPTIEASTMTAVLDFIYVSSSQFIKEECPEELVKILEIAHLLDLKELLKACWELIIPQINSDNCLMIWEKSLLYNERISGMETLLVKFMEDIVKTDAFTNLSISQMKMLLEIMDKIETTKDYLLEGLLNWYKMKEDDENALLELLIYFNFDFVSVEYIDRILQNEKTISENKLLKKFFELQIKPKLKEKEKNVETNLKNVETNFSANIMKNVNIFKFQIGHYFQKDDDDDTCKLALKIIQVFPMVGEESVLILPVEKGKVIECFHWKTEIYLLIQNENNKTQFLVGYHWQNQSMIFSERVSEPLAFTKCLATRNKIYIIGTPIATRKFDSNILRLSCFKRRGDSFEHEINMRGIILYHNIFENLYILRRDALFRNYFDIMLSNTDQFIRSDEFQLPQDLSKVMIATYEIDIYYFIPKEETLTIYKFVGDQRYRFIVECFKWEPMYKCYSTNSSKCIFYSYWGNFFTFDFITHEFKQLELEIPQFKIEKEFVQLELGRNDIFIDF